MSKWVLTAFSISLLLLNQSLLYAQCTKDVDCKGNRICVNGECVEPSTESSGTEKKSSSKPLGAVNIYFQPLGFVQFGPIVGLEIKVAEIAVLDAHWRYSKLGVAYNAIAGTFLDDDEYLLPSSMAFGGGVRFLIPTKSPHRPYAGALFEFNLEKRIEDEDQSYESERDSRSLVFATAGGYRFRIGNSFNLSLGGMFGAAFDVYKKWWYTNIYYEPGKFDGKHRVHPFGMLEVALGWEIGRK